MQVKKIRCMGLPDGVPITHFDTLTEAKAHFKSGDPEAKIVDLLNKYGRQKDSLVNARDYVSDKIHPVFPRLDRKTKKPITGADNEEPETESTHLDRFVAAAVKGAVSTNGLTPTGKDDKEKEKSVWSWIQKTIIDPHGPFEFDLNQAARVGRAKNPPKFALDAATSIIVKGGPKSVQAWMEKFTNGYESKGFGFVDPISFAPFNQTAPAGATAADKEKVHQSNITNLAWAIDAVEQFKRDNQAKKEYV